MCVFLCVYVCMRVYTCMCECICVYACMCLHFACMSVSVHARKYECLCVFVYA